MLTLLGRSPKIGNFDNLYSHKRHHFNDEKIAKNALKAISERTSDNAIVYDFTSPTFKKVSQIFFEDKQIRFSKSFFSSMLKDNIELERSKGTVAIVMKIKPRDNEFIDVADAVEVADHCGFSRVSASLDCLEYQLSLVQDPKRE